MKQSAVSLAVILALVGVAASAAEPGAPTSRPIASFDTTQSGQPILLPQGPVRVSVGETTIPAGGMIVAHKHAYQRMAYILEGEVRVTNLETGAVVDLKPGDVGVEARDQWHQGQAMGNGRVRMLVIDQTPPGETNMTRRDP